MEKDSVPKKSIKSGIAYNGLYQVVFTIAPLITAPYVSRVLGPQGNGTFDYSVSIAYYFFIFAMLGVNTYGNREIAKVRDDEVKRSNTFWQIYYLQFSLGLISTILFVLFVTFVIQENKSLMYILAIYVGSVCTDINWYAFGMEEFKLMTIRNIIVKILTMICIFLFVKKPEDLYIHFLIYACGVVLGLLPMWPFILRTTHFVKPDLRQIISHLKPNFTLFLPFIATSLYQYLDKVMVGSIVSSKEVGFYTYAENILTLPMGLTAVVTNVLLPRSSYLVEKGDTEERNRLFNMIIRYSSIISIGAIFGILAIADLFIPWYLGSDYAYTATLLKILTPVILLGSFAGVVRSQILIPEGKDKEYTIAIFSGAIINVILNIFFIQKWHAIGACITTIIANIAVVLVQNRYTTHVFRLKEYARRMMLYLVNGVIMYLLLMGISRMIIGFPEWIRLIILFLTGVIYYFAATFCILRYVEHDVYIETQITRILRFRKQ